MKQSICFAILLLTTLLNVTIEQLAFASSADIPIQVKVLSLDGKPLSNIVVSISTKDSSIPKSIDTKTPLNQTIMEQIDQQFVPHILVVNEGTLVKFPHTDTVKHHVYSFSPAKTFEISIQASLSQSGILFDQAGIVELGCNIHDWMLGYIYVADTEIHGKTDQNGLFEAAIADTEYAIKLWHPRLEKEEILIEHPLNADSVGKDTTFTIRLSTELLPSFSEFDSVDGLGNYD